MLVQLHSLSDRTSGCRSLLVEDFHTQLPLRHSSGFPPDSENELFCFSTKKTGREVATSHVYKNKNLEEKLTSLGTI